MPLFGLWGAAVTLMLAFAVEAQSVPANLTALLPSRDSVRLLHRAHDAQAHFESLRRWSLPRRSGHSIRRCDANVGRFCYWNDDDDAGDGDDRHGPQDTPSVVHAREWLLAVLDSAAALLPGDAWIAGQRVRYLVEAGRTDAALSAASECKAVRSWCAALVGFSYRAAGNYAAADTAYTAALASMTDAERCRWLDLSLVVDEALQRRFARAPCTARDGLAEWVWWLGAPLYLVGEHTLRTEHFARVTQALIREHADDTEGMQWGDDSYEIVLRYGWPTWYTREDPAPGSAANPTVAGHEPSPTFSFLPGRALTDSPFVAAASQWEPDLPRAPAQYAPLYLKALHALPHQLAIFRRGDSALVIAAYDVTSDTALARWGGTLRAGLFLSTGPRATTATVLESAGTSSVVAAVAPWRPMLVSVEVFAPANRAAARARYGLPLAVHPTSPQLELSDILLYAPGDSTPTDIAGAMVRALPTERVRADRPLGLFWETYGSRREGEALDVSLAVERVGTGLFRRALAWAHLGSNRAPVTVHWRDVPRRDVPPEAGSVVSRAVTVDLSRLMPGRYRLKLAVRPSGGQAVAATREITLLHAPRTRSSP